MTHFASSPESPAEPPLPTAAGRFCRLLSLRLLLFLFAALCGLGCLFPGRVQADSVSATTAIPQMSDGLDPAREWLQNASGHSSRGFHAILRFNSLRTVSLPPLPPGNGLRSKCPLPPPALLWMRPTLKIENQPPPVAADRLTGDATCHVLFLTRIRPIRAGPACC